MKVQWTTDPPTDPGLYWAYEALGPRDADVMLVQLPIENGNTFLSMTDKLMPFSKEHFSHFSQVENLSFAGLEYPDPPNAASD